jgi:hypothetical protein
MSAQNSISIKNLRESIGLRQTEKLNASIVRLWRCGTRKRRLGLQIPSSLLRFIIFYNTVKSHKGISNMTPYEKLFEYYYGEKL